VAGAMTDVELIEKKLAFIETCVRDLRVLAKPAALALDKREERFVEHTLQIAIQAALDVAAHIVADERLGEPTTNKELFHLLAAAGWIPAGLSALLRDMAGFRNVLVHGYSEVSLAVVEDVLRHHVGDLISFVEAVRTRLD
jgi:uncharacterized protein YutE (UPF0331/DUF86 family)